MAMLLGKKIGMTQIFDEDGAAVPVTLIEAGPCYVTQVRNSKRMATMPCNWALRRPNRKD